MFRLEAIHRRTSLQTRVGRRAAVLASSAVLILAACGDGGDNPAPDAPRTTGGSAELQPGLVLPGEVNLAGAVALAEDETFTLIPEYIEIDRLANGASADFGDANLFRFLGTPAQLAACVTPNGADPADGSCDARLPATQLLPCVNPAQLTQCTCTGNPALDSPACINVTYIDWNTLLTGGTPGADPEKLAIHRLLDAVKDDPSSFKNDSCVTTTNVLGKMDLTAGAVANNTEYAYLALKRFDNNGDAGYVWLFTDKEPYLKAPPHSCSEGSPLIYPLTQGDVYIKGAFNPSAGATIVVRRATAAADGKEFIAADAVREDLLTGGMAVWAPIAGLTNLAAVNTTKTRAGVLEVIDGIDQAGNRTDKGAVSGSPGAYDYAKNIFAEAAVDLNAFIDGGTLCELEFFGSVITQPSSSQTSDLKDLLGPQRFNFGSLSVEAEVSPACDKSLSFEVSHVTGPGVDSDDPDNDPLVSCEWTFTNGDAEKTSTDCSGNLPFEEGDPEGDWQADLTVTVGPGTVCTTSINVGAVGVFEEIEAAADLSPGCGLDFDFSGSFVGGSGAATPSWEFSGAGNVNPMTSNDLDGTATVDAQGSYTGVLTITDIRDGIDCTATAEDSVEIGEELSVTAILTPTCELAFGYNATINGGLGTPDIEWEFSGPGTPTPATSDMQSGSVDVDAAGTYTGMVTVSELRGDTLCEASDSTTVDAFEPLAVAIELDETCSLAFDYDSSVSGGSGSVAYDWQFSGPASTNPASSTSASGTVAVDAAGTYTAALTVTDNRTDIDCDKDASKDINVFAALGATAEMVAACNLTFDYTGTIQGGSPAAVGSWAFDGGLGSPGPGVLAGTQAVPAAGLYTGIFSVTDVLPNGVECTASNEADANPLAPIAVSISPSAEKLMCPAFGSSDALTYTALVSGGDGNYTYSWSGCTAANGTCTVNPDDDDFCADASVYVEVDDGSAICDAKKSETELYKKITLVTSTDN